MLFTIILFSTSDILNSLVLPFYMHHIWLLNGKLSRELSVTFMLSTHSAHVPAVTTVKFYYLSTADLIFDRAHRCGHLVNEA